MSAQVQATIDGRSLEEFARLIEQRQRFMNETSQQSVVACSIQFLKSLRAATKVAKLNKPWFKELEECDGLMLSFRSMGKGRGSKKVPCLRMRATRQRFEAPLRLTQNGLKSTTAKIFKWTRRSGRSVYLASSSLSSVQRWVKETERRRIKKFRGLAKLALGRLMNKVANENPIDSGSADASRVANANTKATKTGSGFNEGHYTVRLRDELNYAVDALKGGQGEIDSCLQKAMNSIAAVINRRCENLLGFNKIDIPFPK